MSLWYDAAGTLLSGPVRNGFPSTQIDFLSKTRFSKRFRKNFKIKKLNSNTSESINLSFLASKHQIHVRLLSLKSRYVYPFVNVNEIEPWLTTKNHG